MTEESKATETEDWRAPYSEAFRRFHAMALRSMRELDDPTPEAARLVAKSLRLEGDMNAGRLAERLERASRAAGDAATKDIAGLGASTHAR